MNGFLQIVIIYLLKNKKIYKQIEIDYYKICDQIMLNINQQGKIHTSSGKFIQIRTKDTKPYHPIYSTKHKKNVSNKNYAFYFKKEFMAYVKKKYQN